MNRIKQVESIRRLPIFAGLAESEMQAVAKRGGLRRVTANTRIFTQGNRITWFFIIISGTVQLLRSTPEGDEKTIDLLHPGQLLGATEILDGCHSYRATALVLEDTELAEFSADWLTTQAYRYPVLALNLLTSIAHRTHLAELEAEQQASMSATQLVACFLQRICIMHNADPRGFSLPYSKAVIASRLGIAPETFSRTLKQLKPMGIIVRGDHVNITRNLDYQVCNACSVMEDCETRHAIQGKFRLSSRT